jgi:ribosomal protein S20
MEIEIKKAKELLNNMFVNQYHKTLIKGIIKNYEQNNISKADKEVLQDLLRRH